MEYQLTIEREFDSAQLERTHRDFAAYMCIQTQRHLAKERRGRRIEEAVRTALNGSTPRQQLALPMLMSLPMTALMSVVSHAPPSTVYTQPPVNPYHESYKMMTRPNSYMK